MHSANHPATPAFLFRLVHELRTPVSSLGMLAELLAGRPLCQEDPKAAEYLRKMKGVLEDLRDLLNQVDSLGAALKHGEEGEGNSVALPEILARLEERWVGGDGEGTLQVEPVTNGGEAQGDPRWLEEVLAPVVEGALQAGGEGTVVVEAHPPQSPGGEVRITIRDAGPPPAEPQGFFEPFAHTDPRARRQGGGRSLKLSTAHHRAHHLGGRLTVAHGTDGGAVFTVLWPPG